MDIINVEIYQVRQGYSIRDKATGQRLRTARRSYATAQAAELDIPNVVATTNRMATSQAPAPQVEVARPGLADYVGGSVFGLYAPKGSGNSCYFCGVRNCTDCS